MTPAERIRKFFGVTLPALVRSPVVADDPNVKKARRFADDSKAVKYQAGGEDKDDPKEAEYGWVAGYAKDCYEREMATRDALDTKASEIIKYLGGGAGLFTLTALLSANDKKIHIVGWAIPSFVATISALFFAVRARQPNDVVYPPDVSWAKEYADHYKTENSAVAAFSGQWHLAHQSLRAVTTWMAGLVQASIWCFFLAIFLLVLPVLAAVLGR